MRVRGERTCRNCGATWSYFETGSIRCPECDSARSTGRGDPTLHTDRSTNLDLSGPRETAAEGNLDDALQDASETCLEYIHDRGFIDGGSLRALDESYVHAQELRHAATLATSRLELSDAEREYLHTLVAADPGDRLPAEAVPKQLWAARGLAVATTVREYRDEMRTYRSERDDDPRIRELIEPLREHARRIRALDGEVEPQYADDLLAAARAVGAYCRDSENETLQSARTAVEQLS
ncbi:DUF7117 family protein [Halanaeroarchaeum sulfurireducens]|uniref:TFIIB-type zinc ribbon-containing protein n=1 Tax=Halanaeroarchaeum sulfurireducens TaxID=1604004 RepID=A0A0F7PAY2_9EURY|nr:hypothetical protein [Halanaeroarchaeum sulfurireducens]AKH97877.1 hypothetical protein HLASF_1393 [Halanaeroarchaeum sulfurireducens]ALG82271.1 hypothetical protein HLASA_1380 [Halanaeroarchaeum sulfurireducens]